MGGDGARPPEGKLLEFKRAEAAPPPPPRRAWVWDAPRWTWTPEEEVLGYSVRQVLRGEGVLVEFSDPATSSVVEVMLTADSATKLGYEVQHKANRAEVARQAHLRAHQGSRRVLSEYVGTHGLWQLSEVTAPTGRSDAHGRPCKYVWLEVTGGTQPPRYYGHWNVSDYDRRRAEADFAQGRPRWSCRDVPVTLPRWARKGRCARKAGHTNEHRDREGNSWSSWSPTAAMEPSSSSSTVTRLGETP